MYNSYKISEWEDLSRDELYACLRLRIDVFVVEQDCPYPELDGKDQYSLHLFSENLDISMGNSVKAYLRIVKPGVSYNEPSIGRVAIAKSIRGNGLGKEIMKKALDECSNRWPNSGVRISAQKYLVKFYEDLGFKVTSETYLEDGIPHVQMYKE
ncbi:MAG: GNAT family N-acetyltransferase [Crocinitomicaceae bacterium]|nr:GNAT family N-acetyltransferase [Crocinitomicaceae bacterium]|tara:strand:+ start:17 stop:478 length:462 start_codon:yes stop_codon:yes gene_type:complete